MTCDNGADRRSAGNTPTALTHLLDFTERGLAVKATHTCSEPGCSRAGKLTRGLCVRHYRYWLDHTPASERPVAPRFSRAFSDFVDTSAGPEGCWPWIGSTNRRGYGWWSGDGDRGLAHRVALSRAQNPPSSEMLACHHCDNPPCCNPGHLYWGTAADNARDASERGLIYRPPVTQVCPHGHALIGENLRVYSGKRFCRECMNARAREYQRRKREARRGTR